MTVRQLIQLLSEMPEDADVTDVCGNPISKVIPEPCDDNPERTIVWLDADYIFDNNDD